MKKTTTASYLAEFDVREKSPVIIGIVLAWLGLNLAFTFLVNLPRAREQGRLQEESVRLSDLVTRRQKEVETLKTERDRVMAGSTDLQKFYQDVLATKAERMIAFQREIRAIAERFKIDVKSINYAAEAAPTKDKIARFGAAMPLTGSYESLREFIETIEKSEQFIIINSIELSSSKEGGVILGLSIAVSTYFLDPEMPDDTAKSTRGRNRRKA
ncbi:MAG: type 4a pilus biogenesis protein PilO [Candidatus Polarisedimenticolia bacterium]